MQVLRVALIQTAPIAGDVSANLADAYARIRDVAADCDVAVLPELATTGYFVAPGTHTLRRDDPELAKLGSAGPAVIAGFHETGASGSKGFNSAVVLDGDADPVVQRKLFLPHYGRWDEGQRFHAGDTLNIFDVRGVRLAVLICNDMWQADFAAIAALRGAEVLVCIASSVHSWEATHVQQMSSSMMSFNAIHQQAYTLFVHRCGVENGYTFWGGTCAYDLAGTVIEAPLSDQPDTYHAVLDLADLRAMRANGRLTQDPRCELRINEWQKLQASRQA